MSDSTVDRSDSPHPSPTSALGHFAEELRWWREHRGVSQERLAALVTISRQAVSLIELGRRWPSRDFAEAADRQLATEGVLGRLWTLVDAEHDALKIVFAQVRVTDLRWLALRLAVAVGVDLRLLAASLAPGAGEHDQSTRSD